MDTVKSISYPRTGKRGVPQQFPRRLYNMLESEAKQQSSDTQSLIAWSTTGKAFRIADVNLFSTHVLPKYFRTSKFSSFQRNLNLYGFNKVRRGPDADMYAHPSFTRGRPELLSELKKCKSAADRKRQVKPCKRHSLPPSNAVITREILPAPSTNNISLSHNTRAVSPSSSTEDGFAGMKLSDFYGQEHHANQQLFRGNHVHSHGNLNPVIVPHLSTQLAGRIQLPSPNMQISSFPTAIQASSNPASPTGKLGLLTLAMTCLAESNATTSL